MSYSNGYSNGYSSSTSPPTPTAFNPGQSPNLTFTRPRSPSAYMRSLLVYVDAVNARDFASMEAVFDDALEHRILPKSMARPVLTKRQYLDYWRGVMKLFAKFETKLHEVIEAGDKLTVHGSTRGKSFSGTPYTNEYILLIHFSPPEAEGQLPKIRYLKEFVDSSVSLQFFKEESDRRKRRESNAAETNRSGYANGNGYGSPNGRGYANGVVNGMTLNLNGVNAHGRVYGR